MNRSTILCCLLIFFPLAVPAQTNLAAGGKEVANLLSAVKAANPGDYIVLPSGKKYVLTAAEIAIARGDFDYENLPGVKTETRADGTEIKTISEAHTAYTYPDGQSTHILKTDMSFSAYMDQHIEKNYFISRYVDRDHQLHDFSSIESARFKVFRASVQFQMISDGTRAVESVIVTVYNYRGENFIMRYCSEPGFFFGYTGGGGGYVPVGDSHSVDFDIE
jgi:hypothetical protein